MVSGTYRCYRYGLLGNSQKFRPEDGFFKCIILCNKKRLTFDRVRRHSFELIDFLSLSSNWGYEYRILSLIPEALLKFYFILLVESEIDCSDFRKERNVNLEFLSLPYREHNYRPVTLASKGVELVK